MTETVSVYGREFTIRKPRIQHYMSMLRLIKDLIKEGYQEDLMNLISKAQESDESEDGGVSNSDMALFGLELVAGLDDAYITRLTAILLQGDLDETIALLNENGGVAPSVFMEAVAINAEQADIAEVVKFFRRTVAAVEAWSPREEPAENDAS